MELYFKGLISEEASLEKLVDDLERVVQGADDFARAIGVDLAEHARDDIARRLQRLKATSRQIRSQIVSKARATDRLVRRNPYTFLGAAVFVGLVMGASLRRKHNQ